MGLDKKKVTDIMIDLESLGNEGKFVITDVAFVPFNLYDSGVAEVYLKESSFQTGISIEDSIANGFEINGDTVKWWIQTDNLRLMDMMQYTNTIEDACRYIEEYLESFTGVERFWATATLDYQGISNLFAHVGRKNPIGYNKRMCARTVRTLAEQKGYKYENKNNHDAVQDCLNQIYLLHDQLSIIL